MRRNIRRSPSCVSLGLAIVFVAAAIALPAFAYEYPLSPASIRDAYFLGRKNADDIAKFLEAYTQRPQMPDTGPHVSLIWIETPFAAVVTRSREMLTYSAPAAEKDFTGKPEIFRAHVQIDLTQSYGWQLPSPAGTVRNRPDDFWRDFTVRLWQENSGSERTDVSPLATRGKPIYTSSDWGSYLAGAQIDLDYDPAKIADAPANVEVLTPDGQDVKVTFDLGKLR
jgi:hypothetical protein